MIKKILSFTVLLLISFFLGGYVSAQNFDPADDFINNPPFEAPGFTCGLPDSKANRCCTFNSFAKINKADIDELMGSLGSGNLDDPNSRLGNLLTTLIYVEESHDFGIPGPFDIFSGRIFQEDPNLELFVLLDKALKRNLSSSDRQQLTNILNQRAEKYNRMSAAELLRLQVRKQFLGKEKDPDTGETQNKDRCIIDAGPLEGFCFSKYGQYFMGIVGGSPTTESLIETLRTSDPGKCAIGEAVGEGNSCRCVLPHGVERLCQDYLEGSPENSRCVDCYAKKRGLWTGLGCIRISPAGFIQDTLLGFGVGLAGIVAILCIIYSAVLLQTSGGSPERVKKAREYLTNCIIGLLIIIFSVFILRLVGVNIFQIPGFGV